MAVLHVVHGDETLPYTVTLPEKYMITRLGRIIAPLGYLFFLNRKGNPDSVITCPCEINFIIFNRDQAKMNRSRKTYSTQELFGKFFFLSPEENINFERKNPKRKATKLNTSFDFLLYQN